MAGKVGRLVPYLEKQKFGRGKDTLPRHILFVRNHMVNPGKHVFSHRNSHGIGI
jgi:hypothetical protein